MISTCGNLHLNVVYLSLSYFHANQHVPIVIKSNINLSVFIKNMKSVQCIVHTLERAYKDQPMVNLNP